MPKTDMPTYTIGHIITGTHGYPAQFPRPLYRDGEQIAVVDSNSGPAVVGEMTEDEARERFPAAFGDDDW
jgi:hypothetical protein